MKKFIWSLVVVAMVSLVGVMAGCGGGGGSSSTTGVEGKVTLSVETPPTGALIGGVQGTITLPEGFSVRTKDPNANPQEVASDAFTTLGTAAASSLAGASFTKATRTVKFGLVSATGFSGGDFAVLLVQPPAGASVNAADFTLSETQVVDTSGNTLNLAITKK